MTPIKGLKSAKPEGKVEKSDPKANYFGPERGPFMCKRCEYFNGKDACQKVAGHIDPYACCNLFENKEDE